MGDARPQCGPETAIAFHGHLCPALAVGVRLCEGVASATGRVKGDGRLQVYAGAVTPALDALQSLLGLTIGNGGLVLAPELGADTLVCRTDDGQAIVMTLTDKGLASVRDCPASEPLLGQDVHQADLTEAKAARSDDVLEVPQRDLFRIERPASWRLPWAMLGLRAPLADAVLLRPIGIVHNHLRPGATPPRARAHEAVIEIRTELADALKGLEGFEHLQVLFHFSHSPRWWPLQQHPQGDRSRPVRGVWALRSPHRPNGIGLTTVRLLRVEGTRLHVAGLDAWDGTPVLDIKPYIGWLDDAISSGRP